MDDEESRIWVSGRVVDTSNDYMLDPLVSSFGGSVDYFIGSHAWPGRNDRIARTGPYIRPAAKGPGSRSLTAAKLDDSSDEDSSAEIQAKFGLGANVRPHDYSDTQAPVSRSTVQRRSPLAHTAASSNQTPVIVISDDSSEEDAPDAPSIRWGFHNDNGRKLVTKSHNAQSEPPPPKIMVLRLDPLSYLAQEGPRSGAPATQRSLNTDDGNGDTDAHQRDSSRDHTKMISQQPNVAAETPRELPSVVPAKRKSPHADERDARSRQTGQNSPPLLVTGNARIYAGEPKEHESASNGVRQIQIQKASEASVRSSLLHSQPSGTNGSATIHQPLAYALLPKMETVVEPRDTTMPDPKSYNTSGQAKAGATIHSDSMKMRGKTVPTIWTEEEDQRLAMLRGQGLNWLEIAKHMPGRTVAAMQFRFSTKLKRRTFTSQQTPLPAPLVKPQQPKKALRMATQDAFAGSFQLGRLESEAPMPSHMRGHRNLRRKTISGRRSKYQVSETSSSSGDEGEEQPSSAPVLGLSRLQRHRELGSIPARARSAAWRETELRNVMYERLHASRFIDDASGDVATVAWSPDDRYFAGGAVVLTDANSMQYNRPRNLLVGDSKGTIRELPDHHVARPDVAVGVNSLQSMRETQDPRLFTTIQMAGFSADSSRLHAVSLDGKLSSYTLRKEAAEVELEGIYQHDEAVNLLDVNKFNSLIATGDASLGKSSVSILKGVDGHAPAAVHAVGSKDAGRGRPMRPSALKWGVAPHQSKWLLAGFAQEKKILWADDDNIDVEGDTCLFDGETGLRVDFGQPRNVFDVAWNPRLGRTAFAIACVGFGKLNRGIHTVVRVHGENEGRMRCFVELECPARDLNDVVYNPYDDNMIAAGSTDGNVYIWDIRFSKNYQGPTRSHSHGNCLSVVPHGRPRWETDTGIRFLSWGATANRLFSGSSDGILKSWDPYSSPSDTHISDVATFQSAIMSGAFNSDHTSLLIGEDQGRLNMLEVGHDPDIAPQRFDFLPAPALAQPLEEPPHRALLKSGQIVYEHCGALPIRQAVQGPYYQPNKTMLTPDEVELHRSARAFQRELFHQRNRWKKTRKASRLPRSSCACPLDCAFLPVDEEGREDSRRSEGRVPDELRCGDRGGGMDAIRKGLVAVCKGCGAKCLPGKEEELWCEKCHFACFRCGRLADLDLRAQMISCKGCGVKWQMGVLGYDVVEQEVKSKRTTARREVHALTQDFGEEERAFHLDQAV